MKKSFLFISCEEAMEICHKKQYGEATGWQKIKFWIRHSWCHITQNYSKRNTKLSEVMNDAKVDCLKQNELDKIKETFEKELQKHK